MSTVSPPIIDIRRFKVEGSIASQVIEGLTKSPKTLPALLFYSTEGIQHWNRHSRAAGFYPRHEEMEILKNRASDMAASIADNSVVVDLGSASLDKVLILLDALEAQQKNIAYYALDLSASELESTLQAIPINNFKYVTFAALHGTFDDGLHWLKETPGICDRPHCILLFGLTLGNYSRQNAASFLHSIAQYALAEMPSQSSIIVTLDSCKMPTKVSRAYTEDGVVPFALAALTYANSIFQQGGAGQAGNQELFNVDEWYFLSEWNFILGRHEASLIPRDKDIQLGPPLNNIVVRKDEKIRFGCSYKYNFAQRAELFAAASLDNVASWSDESCNVAFFQLNLRPN